MSLVRASLPGAALLALPGAAAAAAPIHEDPIAPVILGVTGILFAALIGRFAARRLGQPSVLGELLMGVLAGNLLYWLDVDLVVVLREGQSLFLIAEEVMAGVPLQEAAVALLGTPNADRVLAAMTGSHGLHLLQVAHTVDIFSRYGVIFLLFLVGLDSSLEEMRRVGGASTRVALVGVVLPVALGFAATRWLMPDLDLNTDLFVAATLGATSVGITARVLRDLGQERGSTARIVVGAAVVDDILGLVLLAVVTGVVITGGIQLGNVIAIVAEAALFLVAAFAVGPRFLNLAVRMARHLDIVEAKMFISFLFVMVLAWFANLVGLATIVGAFAAGLILHEGYFRYWGDYRHHRLTVRDLILPLEVILVPIFFVVMGVQVKLETFADPQVMWIALALTVAAVVGKVAAGWAAGRGADGLAIGLGMMPRGEVGLVFASIGRTLGVIDDALFSAVVMMVIVTTVLSPPLLKWRLAGNPAR